MYILGAEPLETRGYSLKETTAACVTLTLYLAICQFLVARKASGERAAVLAAMMAPSFAWCAFIAAVEKPSTALFVCQSCLAEGQQAASVTDEIRDTLPDAQVEIRLTDGSKLRGWVSEVTDTGFVLTERIKKKTERRRIGFQDVRSFKRIKSAGASHTLRNSLIVVGIAVVTVGGVLLAIAASAYSRLMHYN